MNFAQPVHSKLLTLMGRTTPQEENPFLIIPATPTKYTIYNIYSGKLQQSVAGFPVLNGGIFPRLCNTIGESGTGKSTAAIGLYASATDYINRKFGLGYSQFTFYDVENHTDSDRIMDVANWTQPDFMTKCELKPGDLSLVDLANDIMRIADIKTKYKKDFLLPSGIRDLDGREVLFLAPTFIVVDSVAQVNPNGVETLIEHDKSGDMKELTSLGNNMEGATDAKAWTIFVRKMKPFLDKANIGLNFINHKTTEISTSMFDRPTRYLPFLKPGEKLKGSKEMIFQSYNLFSLASGEKYDAKNPVYGDSINGWMSWASFVKNKTNIEGEKFPMVFDQTRGYIAELSDFEYLYQNKYGFDGAVKLCMDVLPEVQFTRRTLMDTIQEYPQLARAIQFTAKFHASSKKLNGMLPCSLKDFGQNVPLGQRLSILFNMTNPYGKEYVGQEYKNFVQLSHENRHYWDFGKPKDASNIVLTESNVNAASSGYALIPNTGVTPFDIDLGKAEVVHGMYIKAKEPEYKTPFGINK